MSPREFLSAVTAGDEVAVHDALIADPTLVAARDSYLGSTALHFAAHRGYEAIVADLLAAGADVHALETASRSTPLHWAAEGGHVAIVDALLAAGADLDAVDGWHRLTPLGWALIVDWAPPFRDDREGVVDRLIAAGAVVDAFCAVARGDHVRLRAIAAATPTALQGALGNVSEAMCPIHLAIVRSPELVAVLLALGADPEARTLHGLSALALARNLHRVDAIEALLAHGVAEDASTALIADNYAAMGAHLAAMGPAGPDLAARLLALAAMTGDLAAVNALLAAGADPNAAQRRILGERPADVVPLHLAARIGAADIASALIAAGANPNAGADRGDPTPLHIAAGGGHGEVVRLLVAAGADPTALESGYDATPAGWAEFAGHAAIAATLGPTASA